MPYEIVLEVIPAGYTLSSAKKGERVDVIVKEFTSTEDGDLFVGRLDGFPTEILQLIPGRLFTPSNIDHLLVLIYPDKKAKVFINELEFMLVVQAKRAFEKGQPVLHDDIADVQKLSITGIEIPKNTGLIFLFSIGWRKGLYYDFSPLQSGLPELEYNPEVLFGQLYAYLSFQELFNITNDEWNRLFSQQWFPFISLRRDTIKSIINHARSDWAIDELLDMIRDEVIWRFNSLVGVWRNNPFFQDHYQLLEHAAEMYKEGDYVSATAILYPRIEGILRSYHLSKRENEKASQGNLVSCVINIGGADKHPCSFLLPRKFDTYLREIYFANFDPESPKVVSRHSVSHGIAPAGDFSLKSATIAFLIVDELTYYLRQ
jgi:hypothetical protein